MLLCLRLTSEQGGQPCVILVQQGSMNDEAADHPGDERDKPGDEKLPVHKPSVVGSSGSPLWLPLQSRWTGRPVLTAAVPSSTATGPDRRCESGAHSYGPIPSCTRR